MIGTKIKEIRETQKLSQEYMASQIGITQAAYSKLESNSTGITIQRLQKICELLNVDVSELVNKEQQYINNVSNNKQVNNVVYAQNITNTEEETIQSLVKEVVNSLKEITIYIKDLNQKNNKN